MKRCLILVEGQTEEAFVRDVLSPYLNDFGIAATATIVTTRRIKSGPNFKGGVTGYGQIKNNLQRLLTDTNASVVTTMIDYYALPTDVPGMSTRPVGSARDRVLHVQEAVARDIADARFLPFFVLHEFEALVLANPQRCAWVFESPSAIAKLSALSDEYSSPEEIDDGPRTSPSKRIQSAMPDYQKTLHGPMAIAATGIDEIRCRCPHFNEWLALLEHVSSWIRK